MRHADAVDCRVASPALQAPAHGRIDRSTELSIVNGYEFAPCVNRISYFLADGARAYAPHLACMRVTERLVGVGSLFTRWRRR
jgi:hypothetical protein